MIWLHFETTHSGCFQRRGTVGMQGRKDVRPQTNGTALAVFREVSVPVWATMMVVEYERQSDSWYMENVELKGFFMLWT